MKSRASGRNPSIIYENTSVAPSGWDELADEIFQTSGYKDHFYGGNGGYLVGYLDGKLVTGIPYVYCGEGGNLIIVSMPDFNYGGAIGRGEFREMTSQMFFKKMGVQGCLIVDSSGVKLDLPNPQEATCEIIRFKDYDTWFKSIDGDSRNQIRQSERRGCREKPLNKQQFHALDLKTVKRHGGKRNSDWTEKLITFGKVIGVFIKNKPIGGIVLFKHKKKAYLVKNVSLASGFKYRPNHFLYSQAVKWALENGCISLNSGGAPHTGLREFKRSLGSTTHKYYWYSAYK